MMAELCHYEYARYGHGKTKMPEQTTQSMYRNGKFACRKNANGADGLCSAHRNATKRRRVVIEPTHHSVVIDPSPNRVYMWEKAVFDDKGFRLVSREAVTLEKNIANGHVEMVPLKVQPTAEDLAIAAAAVDDFNASQSTLEPTIEDLATAAAALDDCDDISNQHGNFTHAEAAYYGVQPPRAMEEQMFPMVATPTMTPPPMALATSPPEIEHRARIVARHTPLNACRRLNFETA